MPEPILDAMLRLLRTIDDRLAIAQPWRAWARRHRVDLQISAYAPPGTFYVVAPIITDTHTVVTSQATWDEMMRHAREHDPEIPERAVVEFLAWRHALLTEPGDHA